jgi:hypothetical protein
MRAGPYWLGGVWALVVMASAQAATPTIIAAESTVRLGLTGGYGSYEANIVPQDTETGALFGVEAGVGALTPITFGRYGWPDLYARLSDAFSAGALQYQGNPPNAEASSYRANDTSYFNTAIVRLGIGRPIFRNAEIIPYAAAGYQNWYRNGGAGTGLHSFYQAGMLGGGLKLDFAATSLLVVSAEAEGFALVGSSVSVPSRDFSAGFGASAEERVSLDADYRIDNSWHAYAGLGVTHYGYSGSKPDETGSYEPLSATLEVNSMFGFAYGF